MRYNSHPSVWQTLSRTAKMFLMGGLFLMAAAAAAAIRIPFESLHSESTILNELFSFIHNLCGTCSLVGCLLMIAAPLQDICMSDASRIRQMVKTKLFDSRYGNPLHFKDGELLPAVRCKRTGKGQYELSLSVTSCTVEDMQDIGTSISACLNRRYTKYAVTQVDVDTAFNNVRYRIDDVMTDRSLKVHAVNEMRPKDAVKFIVQEDTYIDLTTSGSMLFAGKTRSGKTTGVISVLLQALLAGRDRYGSEILIIDPKQAELSRLNHVCTLDADGEARGILEAMRRFADTVTKRQKVLNDLSAKEGDAVHWWDAGMHVSLLFIDEYIALRGIFPKRAVKDDGGYNLTEFDTVLKRIVTMGASAGCYAIISIAEASVDEGGLPAMLRSACSTKVLFRPTLVEGRFLWDSDKLKDLPQRIYNSGDAWFSSTDGIHDSVGYVHFPVMQFPVYGELNRLLEEYYNGQTLVL